MSSGSRAGWLSGMFSATKLWNSSSTSGPDATEKPIRPNSSVSSSDHLHQDVPVADLGPAAGLGDVDGVALVAAAAGQRLLAAPRTRRSSWSFTALTRCPTAGFCSCGTWPSSVIRPFTRPLVPRYLMRNCSSASASADGGQLRLALRCATASISAKHVGHVCVGPTKPWLLRLSFCRPPGAGQATAGDGSRGRSAMDISKLPRLSQTPRPAPLNRGGAAPRLRLPEQPVSRRAPPVAASAASGAAVSRAQRRGLARSAAAAAPTAAHGIAQSPCQRVEPGIGAEVWVSAIVGIVLMLLGLNFAKWAITTMFGGTYDTGSRGAHPCPVSPTSTRKARRSRTGTCQASRALQDCGDLPLRLRDGARGDRAARRSQPDPREASAARRSR